MRPAQARSRRGPSRADQAPASGIVNAIATFSSTTVAAAAAIEAPNSAAIATTATVTETLTTVPDRPAAASWATTQPGDGPSPEGGCPGDRGRSRGCRRAQILWPTPSITCFELMHLGVLDRLDAVLLVGLRVEAHARAELRMSSPSRSTDELARDDVHHLLVRVGVLDRALALLEAQPAHLDELDR